MKNNKRTCMKKISISYIASKNPKKILITVKIIVFHVNAKLLEAFNEIWAIIGHYHYNFIGWQIERFKDFSD